MFFVITECMYNQVEKKEATGNEFLAKRVGKEKKWNILRGEKTAEIIKSLRRRLRKSQGIMFKK